MLPGRQRWRLALHMSAHRVWMTAAGGGGGAYDAGARRSRRWAWVGGVGRGVAAWYADSGGRGAAVLYGGMAPPVGTLLGKYDGELLDDAACSLKAITFWSP